MPLKAQLVGEMARLEVRTRALPSVSFTAEDGSPTTLAAFAGKHVLVNFWAPWCAPCRAEMPHLSALQASLGGEAFAVLTIAVGRNSPETLGRFFTDIGVDNLPLHSDPASRLSGAMGVLGLPVSVLIDPQGREIARLQGAANWASAEARALIQHLLED